MESGLHGQRGAQGAVKVTHGPNPEGFLEEVPCGEGARRGLRVTALGTRGVGLRQQKRSHVQSR